MSKLVSSEENRWIYLQESCLFLHYLAFWYLFIAIQFSLFSHNILVSAKLQPFKK